MKIEEMKRSDCCGCEACANICPNQCISMVRDIEGFAYPKINHEACVKCGKCDAVCPSLNFREKAVKSFPRVFAAINPDAKIRRHSSSGGVFTALSEIVLKDRGIVFGAGFDENWHVKHMAAKNLEELENLRGSKYVQSQIGNVYKRVKTEIKRGRKVLFSGTACQCAGLKNFLGKDFGNLLTVDVICHGTPSPALWESYIEWLGRGHEISRVNFRSKRFGWNPLHLEVTFKDCGYYIKHNMQDCYFQEFLTNTILRPSCAACKFRFPNLNSDLTLGDAWGVQNYAPEMFDNRGTSSIIIHTNKSLPFLKKMNLLISSINFETLYIYNPSFLIPAVEDNRRQNFFNDLAQSNLPINTMQKYFMSNPSKVLEENQRKQNLSLAETLKKIVNSFQKD